MKNIYDTEQFFKKYSEMPRSQLGLQGAGEWHQLRHLFPSLAGQSVLDLGCGFGWHCKYAAEHGASRVLGIDSSEKMIRTARKRNCGDNITYQVCELEAYDYPENAYACVISNLVLHYLADLDLIYRNVFKTLKPGGVFVFNIEHPVFTAGVNQEWVYDESGKPLYWPVDQYFTTQERTTSFLGETVLKQHHTLTQILMGLLNAGFVLEAVEEAVPAPEMMDVPGMADELRRPMMLLVRAKKGEQA